MIINLDCLLGMRTCLADNSIDAVVTDPPYGLSKEPDMMEVMKHWMNGDDYVHTGSGFMGKSWDSFVPGPAIWKEVFRVLKPGGHLLAFFGSRTYDLGTMAIRLAGFEIRDQIMWVYGSGFPKSLDVSKAIDSRGGKSVLWFGPWLKEWRIKNDIKQSEIAKLFPSKTGGKTGCVANWELGFNLPTPEQFNIICENYNLPFSSLDEAEREVIGTKKSGIANKDETVRHTIGASKSIDVDITAPATEEAKQWSGWGTALKPAHEPICVASKPLSGTVAENVLTHSTGALNIDGCRVGSDIVGWGGKGAGGNTWNEENNGLGKDGDARPVMGRWPANFVHDGLNAEEWSRFFYCAKASKADRDDGVSLAATSAAEMVDRDADSAGMNSPRAGAGRTSGARNDHPTVKPTALMQWLVRLVTPPGGTVLDPFTGSGSTGKACMLEGFEFIGFEMDPHYCEIAEQRIAKART